MERSFSMEYSVEVGGPHSEEGIVVDAPLPSSSPSERAEDDDNANNNGGSGSGDNGSSAIGVTHRSAPTAPFYSNDLLGESQSSMDTRRHTTGSFARGAVFSRSMMGDSAMGDSTLGDSTLTNSTLTNSAVFTSSLSINGEFRKMTSSAVSNFNNTSNNGNYDGGGNDNDGDGNIELATSPPTPSSQTSPLEPPHESKASMGPSYYTAEPRRRSFLPSPLSWSQRMRELRHNSCMMTPLSALVLLAILLSSLVTMIFTVPQFLLGMLLGPLLRRNFWLVEFLYRFDIARWGHIKIMNMANRNKKHKGKKGRSSARDINARNLTGHSATLQQRITVVPDRVYIHPIPQFMDNIAYLIVCTPPPRATALPIIAILIDCGEAPVIMAYMQRIYEEYYMRDYPTANNQKRQSLGVTFSGVRQTRKVGMELYAVLCTHRHHDHTAGVGPLQKELKNARERRRRERGEGGEDDEDLVVDAGNSSCRVETDKMKVERDASSVSITTGCRQSKVSGSYPGGDQNDIYESAPGNVLVVGGAVERVPHCNLFVKNGCFVPLPCVSLLDGSQVNDMNEIVSVEAIGVPSHTRGSVVFALRNRAAPCVFAPIGGQSASHRAPLQSHLFTGDAIFTGGGGVPFEADLEFASDNFAKNPKSLRSKHGNSKFRPGAGTLSMERCFAEVLTRAEGPPEFANAPAPLPAIPQDAAAQQMTSSVLLYPGHEYTTDLLMRQFDQKTVPADLHWARSPPGVFFATAAHYLASAHRRSLPAGQKLLTVPIPLARERIVNPNFRSLRRRGEVAANALKFWYEFGAKQRISEEDGAEASGSNARNKNLQSLFTTVYSADLNKLVQDLRSGDIFPASAADRIESLQSRLDDDLVGRRPIPSTLPSHKKVYLGVVAFAVLGSAPSAATSSDANIMDMAPPTDCTDRILVSQRRLIAVLDGLGLLANDTSPRLKDIIHLLWQEARLDNELKLDIEHPNGMDVECSLKLEDEIELGLLKLALFGVAFRQTSKFCLPCGRSGKPRYEEGSWVTTSKLRRTSGELVRHDAENCPLCMDVLRRCPYSKSAATTTAS